MWKADRVEVVVLVENWIDMLLPDIGGEAGHCVSRTGLIDHFDPKQTPVQAENGISLLVTAHRGRHSTTVLFDVGLTGRVLLHNIEALGVDADRIDHIVISHGHPDHYGGLSSLLTEFRRPVPVVTHSDAFLPRFAVMGDGRVSSFYNQGFNQEEIQRSQGRSVLTRDAVDLGHGVLTTGEIERQTSFEGPVVSDDTRRPGLYQVGEDGRYRTDEVMDEQGLVIDVEGEGLVVLTGCAHAGVVNTVRAAQRLTGTERVRAVLGGFHLGFPTTPKENVEKTLQEFQELGVGTVIPMHCSGLHAHAAFSHQLADRYVQPAVGSTFTFGGR